MQLSDFDYELPQSYIAQTPLAERDRSRLLVLDRHVGRIDHAIFKDIGRYLNPGDLLVINETRVIPARLFARKLPSGGRVEILLLRKRDAHTWETLVGGKNLTVGRQLQVESHTRHAEPLIAEVWEELGGAERLIHFNHPLDAFFPDIGHVPLPPYIHTHLANPERYQTVYSKTAGSAAAPTAGLHFTPRLMDELAEKGILFTRVTLHVGLDTFAPVTEDNPLEHKIHQEWCQVGEQAAHQINQTRRNGGRVIAVGTTSVRALESSALGGYVQPNEGLTGLFIVPGYNFQVVNGMITNFHLPRSTLIMLVSAFAGRENILNAYETAKQSGYRFYSFGDAMLII